MMRHYLWLTCEDTRLRELTALSDEVTEALRTPESGATPPDVLLIDCGTTNDPEKRDTHSFPGDGEDPAAKG